MNQHASQPGKPEYSADRSTTSSGDSLGASSAFPARILRAIEIALLALIVFVLVRAVITFLAPSSVWPQPEINAGAESVVNRAPAPNAAVFTRFDAFHRDLTGADQAAAPTGLGADAPETTLRLKLTGRRAGPGGSAVLELPDRSQRRFVVDDEIIDGVTLRAVTPDYIVIEQSGRLERLTFDKERVMSESEAASGLSASTPRSTTVPAPSGEPVGGPTGRLGSQVNIDTLITQNSLKLVRRDGTPIGLRISPNSSNNGLSALGLEPGDIVQRIGAVDVRNGLGDPAALMTALQGRNMITVTLLRGDTQLTVDIAQ